MRILAIIFYFFICCSSACDKVFKIGIQDIEYVPFYDYTSPRPQQHFFDGIIKLLEREIGCEFKIVPLPGKRLIMLNDRMNEIDFVFPDNPKWHLNEIIDSNFYSTKPIINALSVTYVTRKNINIKKDKIESLSLPSGFVPNHWQSEIDLNKIKLQYTHSSLAAFKMLLYNRVDAADIEYNVGQYLIKKYDLDNICVGNKMPVRTIEFYLSTKIQPDMLKIIDQTLDNNKAFISKLKERLNIVEEIKTYNILEKDCVMNRHQ